MDMNSTKLAIVFLAEIAALIGFVWWVFVTFYRRDEAMKLESEIRHEMASMRAESTARSNKVEERMDRLESSLKEIAVNTSYIRGKIENTI